MKKIRKILIIIMLATAINTVAQSGYQSFLNGDTIQWNFIHSYSESGPHYFVFIATDTFNIESVPCRKLKSYGVSNRNGIYYYHEYTSAIRQYLSEDTSTGRLWMYFCNNSDTTHFTKKLLVDMSLNVGDTFTFPLYNNIHDDDTLVYVVDSINYINGKKHIYLSHAWGWNHYFFPANVFIEGVGIAEYMFFPVESSGWPSIPEETRVLICAFKDGNLEYYDNFYRFYDETPNLSDCFPPVNGITQVGSSHIKITAYPNPTKDRITFDFGGAVFETLQVINTAGVVVREARLGGQTQYSLPLKGLPAGVYLYRLQNGETATQGKFVVEN